MENALERNEWAKDRMSKYSTGKNTVENLLRGK